MSNKKHLLILGAKSDVGRALAEVFGKNGYGITLAGRGELNREARDLEIRTGAQIHQASFNALDYASHGAFFSQLTMRPSVVVTVFGYLGDHDKAEVDFEEAQRIIDSNFTGAVSILNVVAQEFKEKKSGVIVGISSVAGDRGRQSNYIYGASKAAFTAYLSGLRNRLYPYQVHVLTVLPGFIKTRMTAGMKLPPFITAEPMDVAKVIYKKVEAKSNRVYVLWMWKYIMFIIRNIPESIFKRLKL